MVEVVEDVSALIVIHASPRRHILNQWFLAEVVANHVGHPGVHDLVVGNTGTGCICNRYVARGPGPHQARHSNERVLAEHGRIKEHVIDTSIDHIDPFETLDGAHVHAVILTNDEVGPLHQFGPETLSEERMLEICRVEDARRQHHNLGSPHTGRRNRGQHALQLIRVVVDWANVAASKKVGKDPLGHRPVLQHVTHARRHTQIVLQHEELPVMLHQIRTTDVGPHTARWTHTPTFRAVIHRIGQQLCREHPVGDDALIAVDIIDEAVQRIEALTQTGIDEVPTSAIDNPRDHVVRPRTINVVAIGVHRERDAHGQNFGLGCRLPFDKAIDPNPVDDVGENRRFGRRPTIFHRGVH